MDDRPWTVTQQNPLFTVYRFNQDERTMAKFFQSPVVSRVAGGVMGLVSILGGMVAWNYGDSREPYRYLVAAFVMFGSGILWLVCSIHPKLKLSQGHFKFILVVLVLGLTLGLFHSFNIYGGECGGTSYHHQYRGYPGRWLTNSRCLATSTTNWWDGTWGIDFPSFAADVVFWSGVGLIVSLIWSAIKVKSILLGLKNKPCS